MLCLTLAEIDAAAIEDSRLDPPLTQEQVNRCYALTAPHRAGNCPDCGYPLDSASHRIACGTRATQTAQATTSQAA